MLHSKIVSCTATADAGQQSQMPSRKRRCYTAKSFSAQQRRMLDSKIRCCPGNADATEQNRFLRSNGGCWTAKSDAVEETPMLLELDSFMRFVKKFARIPQNCLRNMYFFTPLVSLIDRGAFSKNAKDIATWSTTIVPRT